MHVLMFGPNSLKRAMDYTRRHRRCQECDGTPIVLRAPDGRYAVCNFTTGLKLARQGFIKVVR